MLVLSQSPLPVCLWCECLAASVLSARMLGRRPWMVVHIQVVVIRPHDR